MSEESMPRYELLSPGKTYILPGLASPRMPVSGFSASAGTKAKRVTHVKLENHFAQVIDSWLLWGWHHCQLALRERAFAQLDVPHGGVKLKIWTAAIQATVSIELLHSTHLITFGGDLDGAEISLDGVAVTDVNGGIDRGLQVIRQIDHNVAGRGFKMRFAATGKRDELRHNAAAPGLSLRALAELKELNAAAATLGRDWAVCRTEADTATASFKHRQASY